MSDRVAKAASKKKRLAAQQTKTPTQRAHVTDVCEPKIQTIRLVLESCGGNLQCMLGLRTKIC